MRLIDADALLKNRFNMYMGFQGKMPVVAVRDIDDAPTIDPDSLRAKGKWELYGNDDSLGCSYFCSKCGASYDEDYFYEHGRFIQFNFCPNCGAKMEE